MLAKAATNIAEGDYKKRDIRALPTQRVDEFGTVARSISQISEDLKSQIKMIAKQRDQFGQVGTNIPDNGTYRQGDIVYNTNAVA